MKQVPQSLFSAVPTLTRVSELGTSQSESRTAICRLEQEVLIQCPNQVLTCLILLRGRAHPSSHPLRGRNDQSTQVVHTKSHPAALSLSFFPSSLSINSNQCLLLLHIPALPRPMSFTSRCLLKPNAVTARSPNASIGAERM